MITKGRKGINRRKRKKEKERNKERKVGFIFLMAY